MVRTTKTFIKHQKISTDNLQVDLRNLTDSAKLLKKTSKTVVNDAINTTAQLKEKLRDTIYRFFAVIDAIGDLVCIKTPDGRWKTLNTFGQTFYNLTKDDYYEKTSKELGADFPRINESLLKCAETDDLVWVENKAIRNIQQFLIDDKEYFFDIIKTPSFTYAGEPKELIIIGRDVTEQIIESRKNSACLTALNSASDLIALLDKNKKIIFFNTVFLNNFPDTENGIFLNEIYSSIDIQYENDKWNQLAKGEIWNQSLTTIVHGNQATCEERIIPIMNGTITPIHYICLLRFPK